MYEQIKDKWKQSYLCTSVGLSPNNMYVTGTDVDEVFEKEFVEPIKKLMEIDGDLSEKDIATAMSQLKMADIPCVYHQLSTIANDYFSKGKNGLSALQVSVSKFSSQCVPVYAMCTGGKTFKTVRIKNSLSGVYYAPVCLLGDCSKFKKYVPEIKELIHKDPTTLPDATIQAIRNAVNAKMTPRVALRHVTFPMPDYTMGVVANRQVTACDEDLPGYFVRKIVNSLPEATIKNSKSAYHAAMEFALTDPDEYRSAISELDEILTKLGDDTLQMSSAQVEKEVSGIDVSGLNRDSVIEWLHVTYGITYDNLKAILIPTAEKVYSSPLLAEGNLEEMSGKDLADQLSTDATGYLDEIIEAYCHEIDMSTDCTVQQLIDSLRDGGVKQEPDTIFDKVTQYLSENPVDENLTVVEFAGQLPHKPADVQETVTNYIAASKEIPVEVRERLLNVIGGHGTMDGITIDREVTETSVVDDLVKLGVNRKLASDFVTARGPVAYEITDEQFYAKLDAMYDIDADKMNEAIKLLNTSNSQLIRKLLKDVGYSEETLHEIVTGEIVKPTIIKTLHGSDDKTTKEFGYKVGEQILYDTRNTLLKDDSMEKHAELTPIMACFMRLLLCGLDEREDVIELIERKEDDAVGDAQLIIQSALETLRNWK